METIVTEVFAHTAFDTHPEALYIVKLQALDKKLMSLKWKSIFDGRKLFMENNLRLVTTFKGRQPLMVNDISWKMTWISSKFHVVSMLHLI